MLISCSYFDVPAWLIIVTPEVPVINPNAYITINKDGDDDDGDGDGDGDGWW
jgi:hypothetical protein